MGGGGKPPTSVDACSLEHSSQQSGDQKIRAFWNGPDADQLAMEWAAAHNAETLEMTPEGQQAVAAADATDAEEGRVCIFGSASNVFAEGAKGVVHVFQTATRMNVASFWAEFEYPALLKNPNVTGIIYHVFGVDGDASVFFQGLGG
jgi:hypothetical protein